MMQQEEDGKKGKNRIFPPKRLGWAGLLSFFMLRSKHSSILASYTQIVTDPVEISNSKTWSMTEGNQSISPDCRFSPDLVGEAFFVALLSRSPRSPTWTINLF